MSECQASRCGKPAGDGFVCRDCLRALEKSLAQTRWVLIELQTTITKQSRFADGGGRVTIKGQAEPMPFNVWAAGVRADYTDILASWVDDLSRRKVIGAIASLSPLSAAAWLMRHLESVRTFEAAGDLVEELCAAYAACRYAIDRPRERLYLGECGWTEPASGAVCTAQLWGIDGDTEAVCTDCGSEYLLDARREQVRTVAAIDLRSRIMSAKQAAEVICAYGIGAEPNPERVHERIRQWAARQRLVERATLRVYGHDRPGYAMGDVIDLVHESDRRQAERAERRDTRRGA